MKSTLIRGAAASVAALMLFAHTATAQAPATRSFSGAVVQADEPVPGVPITLHRVTPNGSGPIGEATSGARGEFRFELPPSDSAAFEVFFATAEHLTVRYFGQPVHGGASTENYTVAVFDTSSALPGAVRVARRDIVLIPETQGGWEANEIIRLHNSADRTLVSKSGLPTWEMRLPEGVTDFEAGEGELTAAEVSLMDDRVLLLAPVTPGDREPLFLRYRVPLALEDARFAIDTPTDTFNVFVGQPSPSIEVSNLLTTKVVEVQGERFVQYGTSDLGEGEEVGISWDAPAGPPIRPEIAGAAAALLVLLVGSWIALRNRIGPAEEPGGSPAAG